MMAVSYTILVNKGWIWYMKAYIYMEHFCFQDMDGKESPKMTSI